MPFIAIAQLQYLHAAGFKYLPTIYVHWAWTA